ncbi:MAG TPA: nucleotide exchange factor GrpE, partial [Parachlamydiaceae bacterium]|nr:nucleotide exchange factor GrpE [Parachlamydiaceae bacterium]
MPEDETKKEEEYLDSQNMNQETEEKIEREPIDVTITDIELETLKKDASDYKDKYLRLLAEMENTRKRLQKERQELTQYAIQNVIVDFLNPIDHMENALNYTD